MSEISPTERRAALQSGLYAVIAGLLEDLRKKLRLKHRRVEIREETKLARRAARVFCTGVLLIARPAPPRELRVRWDVGGGQRKHRERAGSRF